MTPAGAFRQALREERPLQIIGVVNAYVAKMAQEAGYRALYLSGAGVANNSYALPDLGMTTLDNVLEDVRRVTAAVKLPLLVDIDTGWGHPLMIQRTVTQMESAGVAAVHIEDQPSAKRCGHRDGKSVVPVGEMQERIAAAVEARKALIVMARSDALAVEGFEKMVERCIAYKDAGADMLFVEALTDVQQYRRVRDAVGIPILANMTEFGKTPLISVEEFSASGVDMVLYPLSVTRAMNKAAWEVLHDIRSKGSQRDSIPMMQTRDELYRILNYESYEKQLN